MNEERTSGLVLRTYPLTETSLIVAWLTPNLGRISTVAKGARRPKSPFRGLRDVFYRCEFSFARSRRSELHLLREVRLVETHARLRQDMGWLRQAAYAAMLIEQNTEKETPLPEMFALLGELLAVLAQHPPQPLTVLAFELKLLRVLGLEPDLAEASLSPGAKIILDRCQSSSLADLFQLKPSPIQTVELRQFLHGFLVYHLDRIPSGRAGALGE